VELRIESISKRYQDRWAVRDLTLSLRPGILALLGPNGAGKSSLMRMLATITRPTSGRVLFNGEDTQESPDCVRRVLGYLPQDFAVYPNLSAIEFLEYIAALKGLDSRRARVRIDELLALVNLTHARHQALGGFSGGMRQRVGIAQALLNDPQFLIVDEPTAGLDPEERATFRGLLSDLAADRIIIFSTHICSDVESIASQVAVIREGKLLYHGPRAVFVGEAISLEGAYLSAIAAAKAC